MHLATQLSMSLMQNKHDYGHVRRLLAILL